MHNTILEAMWSLTAFLASGASIPTTIASKSIISDSTAAVNNTSNPSLIVKPSCIVPPGSYVNITIRSCQPALNELMLRPDSSRRVEYQWEGHSIQLTGAPCIIGLHCTGPCPDILLSARQIVGYAYGIITECDSAAIGWMRTDGSSSWIVVVKGAAEANGVVNATVGENGNTALGENQGEQDNGLIEPV